MTEIPENSRVETIDYEVFRRLRGREMLLMGREFEEMLEVAPNLSVPEVGELDLRLRADGFLSQSDTNRSLAMMAIHARSRGDGETIRSLRNHFLKRLNLVGAGLVYVEERKFIKEAKQA